MGEGPFALTAAGSTQRSKRRIEELRHDLTVLVNEADKRRRELTDWRLQVSRHRKGLISIGLGILLATTSIIAVKRRRNLKHAIWALRHRPSNRTQRFAQKVGFAAGKTAGMARHGVDVASAALMRQGSHQYSKTRSTRSMQKIATGSIKSKVAGVFLATLASTLARMMIQRFMRAPYASLPSTRPMTSSTNSVMMQ